MYIRIVYTQRGSVEVWQATGSLLLFIIVCCCLVLCYRSSGEVSGLIPELLIQSVRCVRDNRRTVPQDSSGDAMASGDSRHGVTGVGSVSGFGSRFPGMLLSRL